MSLITQKHLKTILNYDQETGVFFWLSKICRKVKIGSDAGCYRKDGYLIIGIQGRHYLGHHLAWLYTYGSLPEFFLDHINMNRSDNRICNLRNATKNQNNYNRLKLKTNKTGFKGVMRKKNGRFVAQCMVNSKNHHLGVFDNALEAADVYEKFAIKNQGTFFRLDTQ